MRIAFYSDNFYPELSGISDSIIMLAQALAKRGHIIDFYVPRYTKTEYEKAALPEKEPKLGKNIFIHRFFSLPYPGATGQARIVIPTGIRALDVQKQKPDIIHTQLIFGAGLEALAASNLLHIPLVGTNHTPITEFERYTPIRADWTQESMVKYVTWYYNHCAFVTAPSSPILEEMKKNGFTAPHMVLSNPIDTTTFRPVSVTKKRTLKKKYKLSSHTLLYSGRLAPEKHVDVLIESISLLKKTIPDIHLAITGRGIDDEKLKELVHTLNLDDHVTFFGSVSKKHLAELYQASDIFTIASTAETQSLALMNAMASQIPVIGVSAWGLPDYIKNNKNGYLIKPHKPALFAQKISYLFSHPKTYETYAKEAYTFVQDFSLEHIARKWEEIYEQIKTTS